MRLRVFLGAAVMWLCCGKLRHLFIDWKLHLLIFLSLGARGRGVEACPERRFPA